MQLTHHNHTTRRSFLQLLLATAILPSATLAMRHQTQTSEFFDLGNGLEIRDYRLLLTKDVLRFIVEIHNTTDTAVDAPTVGVVLPHLDTEKNFGWASPSAPVLHPKSSGCLIGVAPSGIASDEDWGQPEWTLCGDLERKLARTTDHWLFDLVPSIEFLQPNVAKILLRIDSQNNNLPERMFVHGLVLDSNGRLCGTTVTGKITRLAPMETRVTGFTISPEYSYISNPFNLIENVDGISAIFTMQPSEVLTNQHCEAVMPW